MLQETLPSSFITAMFQLVCCFFLPESIFLAFPPLKLMLLIKDSSWENYLPLVTQF